MKHFSFSRKVMMTLYRHIQQNLFLLKCDPYLLVTAWITAYDSYLLLPNQLVVVQTCLMLSGGLHVGCIFGVSFDFKFFEWIFFLRIIENNRSPWNLNSLHMTFPWCVDFSLFHGWLREGVHLHNVRTLYFHCWLQLMDFRCGSST